MVFEIYIDIAESKIRAIILEAQENGTVAEGREKEMVTGHH